MAVHIPARLHRKRWRQHHNGATPLPIPIASLTAVAASDDNWCYCTGRFVEDCVLVTDPKEMAMLYSNGFFGKGTLSKCDPDWDMVNASSQQKRQPPNSTLLQPRKKARVNEPPAAEHKPPAADDEPPVTDGIVGDENFSWTSQHGQLDQGRSPHNGPSSTDHPDISDHGGLQAYGTSDWEGGDSSCWQMSADGTIHTPAPRIQLETANEALLGRTSCAEVNSGLRTDDLPVDRWKVISDKRTCDGETGRPEVPVSISQPRHKNKGVRPEGGEIQEDNIIATLDQNRVQEALQLSLEEAFFLSYGLGCLSVLDGPGFPMTLVDMWQRFTQTQHNFLSSYIAYHYLRSKGWVPRAGVKYGAPWVLYRKGPSFYHSSYSVVVQMVDADSLKPSLGLSCCRSWTLLAGMDRITQHVGKEVLLCFVLKPSDMTEDEQKSPRCISRFKVQEVIVKRWVSSQNHGECEDEC